MAVDYSDPEYYAAARERLKARFGGAAIENAMRDLMEDPRVKKLVPEGAAIIGTNPDRADTVFIRYLAISSVFEIVADPQPEDDQNALHLIDMFVRDAQRLETDKDTLWEAVTAIHERAQKLESFRNKLQ